MCPYHPRDLWGWSWRNLSSEQLVLWEWDKQLRISQLFSFDLHCSQQLLQPSSLAQSCLKSFKHGMMNNRCLTAKQLELHVSIALVQHRFPLCFLADSTLAFRSSPIAQVPSDRPQDEDNDNDSKARCGRSAAILFLLWHLANPKLCTDSLTKQAFLGALTGRIGDSLSQHAKVCTRISFFCLTDAQVYRILSNNNRSNLQKSQFTSKWVIKLQNINLLKETSDYTWHIPQTTAEHVWRPPFGSRIARNHSWPVPRPGVRGSTRLHD